MPYMFCVYNRFSTYEPNMIILYFRVENSEGVNNFSFAVEALIKTFLERAKNEIPDFQEVQNEPIPEWLKGFRYNFFSFISLAYITIFNR